MKNPIRSNFGTWRGMTRLALSYLQLLLMPSVRLSPQDLRQVRRLVFVCHGNICRSAVAQQVARKQKIHSISVGLSTDTGTASPVEAIRGAAAIGVDLLVHRATAWEDYTPIQGDLLLAMEFRHVSQIRQRLGKDTPKVRVSLLGLWCRPIFPHLHDPYTLSARYFEVNFERVRTAVENLLEQCRRETAACLHDD